MIHLHLVITNIISLLNKVSYFSFDIFIFLFIYIKLMRLDIFIVDGTDICTIILSNVNSSAQTKASIFVRKFFKCLLNAL